jgi:hypothetical protein
MTDQTTPEPIGLAKIAVGDSVAIHGNGLRYPRLSFGRVVRVTATQLMLEDGSRWMISTGFERRGGRTIFGPPNPCRIAPRPAERADA